MNKILIIHTVLDTLSESLEKVKKLNQKNGPFNYCLVLSREDLKDDLKGLSREGLPTLLTFNSMTDILPSNSTSSEISDGVLSFNGCGIYKFSNGLSLGYLTYNGTNINNHDSELKNRIKELSDSDIDILITYEWSNAISQSKAELSGTSIIDTMVQKIQPKYHFAFSKSDQFVESGPFIWRSSSVISRFLNIPEYGKGKRWAYAFQLDSSKSNSEVLPESTADNPYTTASKKRSLSDKNEFNLKKDGKLRKILPEMCHFCFSNKDLQDHMIVSISDNAYVTIAKGPLSEPYDEMSFSGHCLVIPIEHIPKLNNGENSDIFSSNLYKEMMGYEKSIITMNYRKFNMSSVSFEINSERSIHYHKQIIPVPRHLILKFASALDRQCYFNNKKVKGNANLDFEKFTTGDEEFKSIVEDPKSNYVQFTVYETSESEPKIYLAQFQLQQRLDLQFGRRVLAFLLHLPKRVKWDSPLCLQTPEEETKEAQAFQKGYRDYDIASK
ncbi:CWF19-like protein Drn1p [Monosporozyma unispora]|nr:hypothetical protein C6P44_004831 [Kazachstania unispora]